MVRFGEINNQRLGSGLSQLGGGDRPMVQVGAEAAGGRQVQEGEARGQAASERAEPGMPLADVVEQRCPSQRPVSGRSQQGVSSGLQAVTLVGRRLCPEELPFGRSQ